MVNIVWLGLPTSSWQTGIDPRAWPAMVDALQKIRKDIKDKRLQGKAYVNISYGFQLATFPVTHYMRTSMIEAVKGVTGVDALVIMAAGNDGKPILSYPQALGQINKRVVVTGAVDDMGNLWTGTSTANWVKINAAGDKTLVIGSNLGQPFGPIEQSGTSFSEHLLRKCRERN